MKTKWWTYQFEDVDYYKFSIYRFGSNMQTVYLFKLDDTIIDTGQANSKSNVKLALKEANINQIILTHYHEDHTGNTAYLKKKFKAKVYAHQQCAEMMTKGFTVSPLGRLISGSVKKAKTISIQDGHVFDFENYQLKAIHTPGHTDDHMSYFEPNRGWLFSGDLYVADRIKYFESNENIKTQIESIRKLVALDFEALFCSHNPKPKGGKKRLQRKLELFEAFYAEVLHLHDKGYGANEILATLGRKENLFYKFMTVGHFTAVNMVKSVLKAENKG